MHVVWTVKYIQPNLRWCDRHSTRTWPSECSLENEREDREEINQRRVTDTDQYDHINLISYDRRRLEYEYRLL